MGDREIKDGDVFGRLTVVHRVNGTRAQYICLCKCGETKVVYGHLLRSEHTKSCGCLRKKGRQRKDRAGQKFGRLTAIKDAGYSKRGSRVWKFLCDCGNKKDVEYKSAVFGGTKSCGCLEEEKKMFPEGAYSISRGKRQSKYLSDNYICNAIRAQYGIKTKYITPEMIELKRAQLKIYRALKKAKKETK